MNINIIKTMKQALEALQGLAEDLGRLPEEIQAISCLRAAIDAAEKQEPVAWASKSILERLPDFDGTIYARGGFDDATPLYTHPAPTQPDSEQAKIGCIGHDGECCKDREQVYLDADRYRKECDQLKKLWFDDVDPAETKYADEYAAMKVGADKTGEGS